MNAMQGYAMAFAQWQIDLTNRNKGILCDWGCDTCRGYFVDMNGPPPPEPEELAEFSRGLGVIGRKLMS